MNIPDPALSVGPLGRIARFAYRRRGTVLLLWVAGLLLTAGLAAAFGGTYTADYSVPGSDSARAQQLLEQRFPQQADANVTVVVHADHGVTAAQPQVTDLLTRLSHAPHAASVDNPYATPGAISADGHTLIAHVRMDVTNPEDISRPDSRAMIDIARAADGNGIEVGLSGQNISAAQGGGLRSEGIGLIAAAVILLLTFGTVVAAGLPILTAISGLVAGSAITAVAVNLFSAPNWAPSLAAMMGIGIGIDYVLLMVTRFREWRAAGLDPQTATEATLDTAGRAVVVAGSTVVISMLGLLAIGVNYIRGAALVTIIGVLLVLAASITLFPALLGYLGRHVDRLRVGRRRTRPQAATGPQIPPSRFWTGWSRLIEQHRYLAAVIGVAVLLGLAAPFLGVRFGLPDAGNDPAASISRQAYDMIAAGFGPGANGPLLLAVELPPGADLTALTTALAHTPGVATVTPPELNQTGDTAVLTVIPSTGPQDQATADLVRRLRDQTLPRTTAASGMTVALGGFNASAIDSTNQLSWRIPYLIAGVVVLSMLLLLVAFRSIAVAVKAALMNLLSVAAAYGVVAVVLRGGWAGRVIGIDGATPLPPFIPVLMFAILFGLSMDYEVFLVSRMRETWLRTGDNHQAVTRGLAGTGRVITAAAAIMVAVFLAFVPSTNIILKVIGIGLAMAILLDATVIRLLLVPAVMHILGRANWWLPRRLHRTLPELHIEGPPETYSAGPGRRAPSMR